MDDRIIADLRTGYGIVPKRIRPITGGWLNQLWRVSGDTGDFVVKRYSPWRFSRHQLKDIESALQRQRLLKRDGVPCPEIYTAEDKTVRFLDDGAAYSVMDDCPGKNEGPDTITLEQMHSLGSTCAVMHRAFSRLSENGVKGDRATGRQRLDSLWTNYHTRLQEDAACVPEAYRRAVQMQRPILLQLNEAFFDRLPRGLAHEDFTADNLLFDANGVSAIIDFDRNQTGFVWHDIGRALLSFALEEGRMNREKVRSFLGGYTRHLPLTMNDIIDALRISWCIEIPWWIQPEFFTADAGKATRYRDEILWLGEHWFALDSMLSNE